MKQGEMIGKRIRIIWACVLLLFVVAFVRVAYLQTVMAPYLKTRNLAQIQENKPLQSPRGTIYDTNGREIAVSSVTKSLYGDPKMLNKPPEEVARLLAPHLSVSEGQLIKSLSKDGSFVWLERMLDKHISDAVAKVIKDNKIEGLDFVEESKRYYPNGVLAAQVIGFVGIDDKGLDGIEMVLDKKLLLMVEVYPSLPLHWLNSFPIKKEACI